MIQSGTRPILRVSESAQFAMSAAALRAHPCETGGLLVGVYLDGQPWVTSAIEIPTAESGRNHFRIPSGATQPVVRAARRVDERVGYLGDWHSHPRDLGPSPTDMATLALISVRNRRAPNPTLIVMRRVASGYSLDARRIHAAVARACVVRMVGDLPHRGNTIRPSGDRKAAL